MQTMFISQRALCGNLIYHIHTTKEAGFDRKSYLCQWYMVQTGDVYTLQFFLFPQGKEADCGRGGGHIN